MNHRHGGRPNFVHLFLIACLLTAGAAGCGKTSGLDVEQDCVDGLDDDGDGLTDCDDGDCADDAACQPADEICDDSLDNDEDGATDCDDTDCEGDPACPAAEICDDSLDNDEDGATDCDDTDCEGDPVCPTDEICDDAIDNDLDGLTDCDDSDCADALVCPIAEICDDSLDNDQDGATDCDDTDCHGQPACQTSGEDDCTDGVDNDDDGATDCDDTECAAAAHCLPESICYDGVDNDLDGLIDCEDADCAGVPPCPQEEICDNGLDDDGNLLTDCEDPSCHGHPYCQTSGEDDCTDGLDNDDDGAIDCADTECLDVIQCQPEIECADGLDNNEDGLTDCEDQYCAPFPHCQPEDVCDDDFDNDLDGLTDCEDEDCAQEPHCLPEDVCDDGFDNDFDGLTDCEDEDCLLAPNCLVYCVDDQYEPNDTQAAAAPLQPGTYNLFMCGEDQGEEDWFVVHATAGQRLAVSLFFSHQDVDIDLYLRNAAGQLLDQSASTTDEEHASAPVPQDGVLFVRVRPYDQGATAYELQMALDPACTVESERDDCAPGEVCIDFACASGCRDHLGCPDGEACVDHACIPGCRDDIECATGEICEQAVCLAGCRLHDQCPPGEICVQFACVAGCLLDDDCAAGEMCWQNQCLVPECRGAVDCAPGQVCLNYACTQIDCAADPGVCPPGLPCDPATGLCAECLDAGDCPDATAYTCQDGACVLDCPEDPFEPNSQQNDAAALSGLPVSEAGLTLCGEHDEDWFSIELEALHVYQFGIFFADADGDIDFYLRDGNGGPLASGTSSTDDEQFTYLVPSGAGGTYLLRVTLYTQGDYGQVYDLAVTDQGAIECTFDADCGPDQLCRDHFCYDCPADSFEPNGGPQQVAPLGALPVDEAGLTLCGEWAEDWLALDLLAGTVYSFDIAFSHADGNVDLYIQHDLPLPDPLAASESSSDGEHITFLAPATGTYFLWTQLRSGFAQTYDLQAAALGAMECLEHSDCENGELCADYFCTPYACDGTHPCPNGLLCDPDSQWCVECLTLADCPDPDAFLCQDYRCALTCAEDGYEPNSSQAEAAALPALPVDEPDLSLCGHHDQDWFQVDLPADRVISFDLAFSSADGDIDLALFGPGMAPLASSTDGVDGEHIGYRVPTDGAGTYSLRVLLYTGGIYSQDYGLFVTDLGAPDCTGHLDCPLGALCWDMVCQPFLCDGAHPCPDGLLCDGGSCAECLTAADCPNATEFTCGAGRCELDCVEDGHEPNGSLAEAAPIGPPPFSAAGLTLCGQRAEDWFAVDLEADTTYAVDLAFVSADGDIDLALFDSAGEELAHSWYGVNGEHIEYQVPPDGAGTHYVQVRLYTQTVYRHTYDLAVYAP